MTNRAPDLLLVSMVYRAPCDYLHELPPGPSSQLTHDTDFTKDNEEIEEELPVVTEVPVAQKAEPKVEVVELELLPPPLPAEEPPREVDDAIASSLTKFPQEAQAPSEVDEQQQVQREMVPQRQHRPKCHESKELEPPCQRKGRSESKRAEKKQDQASSVPKDEQIKERRRAPGIHPLPPPSSEVAHTELTKSSRVRSESEKAQKKKDQDSSESKNEQIKKPALEQPCQRQGLSESKKAEKKQDQDNSMPKDEQMKERWRVPGIHTLPPSPSEVANAELTKSLRVQSEEPSKKAGPPRFPRPKPIAEAPGKLCGMIGVYRWRDNCGFSALPAPAVFFRERRPLKLDRAARS